MTEYSYTQYSRLTPYTKWNGGRITDVDLLTLDEAASLATKHAKTEITINDFLRAAKRGEILLRAIVHKSATMQPCRASDAELFVPATSFPTLPIEACQSLANVSVAKWRHINWHEPIEILGGQMGTYKRWELPDEEPDFETNLADCRVIGNDVHALADSYISNEFDKHWDDLTYKSSFWRRRQSVSAIEAAIIFHGMNPLEESEESAKTATNYDDSNENFKSTPEDFKLLLRHFKEVEQIQPMSRTLKVWQEIAKSEGLKTHPRIEKWFEDDETVPATLELKNKSQSIDVSEAEYIPSNAIGQAAIKAAREIEIEVRRIATAKEVMNRLQDWADGGNQPDVLKKSDRENRAVMWITSKGGEKPYSREACGKTLEKWNKSRKWPPTGRE
jgi:hypothetical protein